MTANPGTSASDDGAGFATSEFREEENANGLTAREVLAVIRRRWFAPGFEPDRVNLRGWSSWKLCAPGRLGYCPAR